MQKNAIRLLNKATARRIVEPVHRWHGLASGLVIFIVSLTGALLTFEEEIEYHLISPNLWFVNPPSTPPLPVDSLMDLATPELLKLAYGQKASRVFLFPEPTRSTVVGFNYEDLKGENHRGHVFLNPYTD